MVRRLILLLACASASYCQAGDVTNSVMICGFGAQGTNLSYFVPWSQLLAQASWEPGHQLFPIDLAKHAQKAFALLDRFQQIGGSADMNPAFDFRAISIRRVAFTARQLEKNGVPGHSTSNKWITAFTFYENGNEFFAEARTPAYKHVVLLFDGTPAFERLDTFSNRPLRSKTNDSRGAFHRAAGEVTTAAVGQKSNPHDQLVNANLGIPNVQWSPLRERLPMDLQRGVAKAHVELTRLLGSDRESLTLQKIDLSRFTPAGTTDAVSPGHWLITYSFATDTKGPYKVYALMDNRVVRVELPSEQTKPPHIDDSN